MAEGSVGILITRGALSFNLGQAVDTLEAWIRTRALDFGEPLIEKSLDRIAHTFDMLGEHMKLRIYVEDPSDSEVFILSDECVTERDGITAVRPQVSRRFKIEFRDFLVNQRWTLGRIAIYGEAEGEA